MNIDLNTRSLTSESKKKKSSRSLMLKMVMPMLSGKNATDLAKAIEDENPIKAQKIMERISKQLASKMKAKKKK